MKAFIIIVAYEYKTSEWQPRMKKFLTFGETLEKATAQLLKDFRDHNSPNVGRNARAVNAAEVEADLAIPETRLPIMPTA